ncbi:MAG: hypothetical protein Q8P12_04005 [bacterium]|nr:hypothetical protein [bacterium]
MNPLGLLVLFVFSVFLLLAGYTARLWISPIELIAPQQAYFTSPLTSSWNTTIVGRVRSVSDAGMVVAETEGFTATLDIQFFNPVIVQEVVQRAGGQGIADIQDITVQDLRGGDRVIVYASLGNDNVLYATRIDRIVAPQ